MYTQVSSGSSMSSLASLLGKRGCVEICLKFVVSQGQDN